MSSENTEQAAAPEGGGEIAPQEEGGEAAQQQEGGEAAQQQEGGEAAQQQPQQQARPSGWQIARSVLFQIVIFYFISSLFRGRQQPATGPDGKPATAAQNLFPPGQEMELYVYVTESADFDLQRDRDWLVWNEELKYGNWKDGPFQDGTRQTTMNLDVPEGVQHNGSWHLHLFLVKYGFPLDPEEEEYNPQAVVYNSVELTKYRKRRIHETKNLLTGEAEIAPGSIPLPEGGAPVTTEIISYYHPNLTINLVDDQLLWTKGSVPQPLDKHIVFDEETGNYFPVLYFNDYWNLAQDYMPLNDTTPYVDLSLVFAPITLFKFNMYCSVSKENPWSQLMGGSDPTDEDQDTVKQTLMETNPYLLGLTVVVSIVHSVFEFLAFKNDVQFWRSRKSLEGLSVRSVFFNVFQSLIVLLYILDNETNTVVIISVFVGLCIELWKVTKVVQIKVDRENMIAGFIPRIIYVDQPSYASSTKEYDIIAFKYLGCILFPLFICYGIYSLIYVEHKGWYSFLLSMSYGFLLTFGFITMTPQLFINYKLKSVAHLPWRMLTYKALNTFIDDMFAFVIKMPTMYRIGCFRDDIVFFIFLYQRWIYRVDPKRVNEFGTTGEDSVQQTQGGVPIGEISQGPPDSSQASSADEEVKSEEDKKNE